MGELRWTGMCCVIAMALLLMACARQMTTTESIGQTVGSAGAACDKACAGNASNTTLVIPLNATFYTTPEAICARYNNRLLCSVCQCGIASNITIPQPGTYDCVLSPAQEQVSVSCAPVFGSP